MGYTSEPGLDLTLLRGLRTPSEKSGPAAIGAILPRIEAHLAAHDGYVAFSCGKDSLVVLDLAHRIELDVPVVFFDSGLDYPETYDYLTELAHPWRLDLHRIPTDPPLLQVLADSGHWDHTAPAGAAVDLHEVLITEPARRAHALLGPGELWGVRADESAARRMLYTRGGRRDGIITRADGTTAYGPIWNWTTTDVWAHIARHQLPVNPVYAKLRELGVPEQQHRLSHLIDGGHLDRRPADLAPPRVAHPLRATRRHPPPHPTTELGNVAGGCREPARGSVPAVKRPQWAAPHQRRT